MSIDYGIIGTRIQNKRKAKGLTQEKLAEILDVSVGYVSQIERGISKPNLEMLSMISSALGCDICYLIGGTVREQATYLDEELILKYSGLSSDQKALAIRIIDAITG